MTIEILKIGFYGNPYLGLFLKSNDKITLMPLNRPEKFKKICNNLRTEEIHGNVFGSPLLGLYSVMNNNGILFAPVIQKEEIESIKKEIKEKGFDTNVDLLETKFTAISNNIVVNNKKCLINPKMYNKKIKDKIKDILDVETIPIQLENFNVIGSIVFANDNGFIAHPGLNDNEIDIIEEALGVHGGIGTANGGVPFLSLCLVGNNKSVVFGEATTAFEQQRIIEALGFE